MARRQKVQGRVDIHPLRSRDPKKRRYCYVNTLSEGNRKVLQTSELLSSRRRALHNIAATARVYGGTPPLIRDYTGRGMRLLRLELSGLGFRVFEVET